MRLTALTLAALAILAVSWWRWLRPCAALAADIETWRDCRCDRLQWEHDELVRLQIRRIAY